MGLRSVPKKALTLLNNSKVKFKDLTERSIKVLLDLPGWLKSRPASINFWLKENRKKKKYHSFKLEKKINPDYRNIPTSWQLTRESFSFFFKNFWVFFCLMFIHAAFFALLVYGPVDFNLKEVQGTIKGFFGDNGDSAASTFALLGSIVGAKTQRDGSAIFNFLIILTMSLAYIWTIRRLLSKKAFNIRDAFYNSMAPVIPVLTILFIMILQLLPFTIASYLYTVGRTNGIFISGLEDLVFFLIAVFAGLLSFYLMTPSILSIYAVTLPGMYPLTTIRLTKKIVQFRRFLVFRRVVALPFIVAIIFFCILLLLLRFTPQSGIWFVQIFPIFILPLIHIYLFKLYKSLI